MLAAGLTMGLYVILPASALADEKVLRVVGDENYPPFLFLNADGKAEGYLVDLWRLWERKTGVKVELRARKWDEAQQVLLRGEADVIENIFRTPGREPLYEFSQPYADLPVAIYKDVSLSGLSSLRELKGFRIGVMEGDACIEKLKSNGIDSLVPYGNYKQLIQGALAHDIKIFCLDEYPANYYLYQLGAHKQFKKAFPLYQGQFHRAVRKGNASTLALVESGMSKITNEEKQKLLEKWIVTSPDYETYAKYALVGGLALGLLVGILFIWITALRRAVSKQTQALNVTLSSLEAAVSEVRDANENLAALLNASPDMLFEVSPEGEIYSYHSSSEALLAVPAEQFLGKRFSDILPPEVSHIVLEALQEAHALGVSRGKYYTLQLPQGNCWFELSVSPIKNSKFTTPHFIMMVRDISDQKRAEAELLQYRNHLEELIAERSSQIVELNKQLERRAIEAEAASIAKSTFLSNMSHEIRTPMNAILGFTHLLRQKGSNLSESQKDQLEKIQTASNHLLSLINDILELSKIESGKLQLEQVEFDCAELMDKVSAMVAERAHEKELILKVDINNGPLRVVGDSMRLTQMLLNYLGNAIKFTERGNISLHKSVLEETEHDVLVRFEVEDTGIGVTEEQKSLLFKPFMQADSSTTRRFGGTGLGLAITLHLAHLMGGEAGVESKPGKGSTFWITARLLKAKSSSASLSGSQPSSSDLEALRRDYAGKRVLVVEDNEINREVAGELLAETLLAVDYAENGQQALEKAGKQHYDLILMDVQMPVMGGIEATVTIRMLDGYKDIPIIAMTANAFAEDRQACLTAGMNDHLAKPVVPELLYRSLTKWLRP